MENLAGVLDRRFEALIVDALLVAVVVGALGHVAGTTLDVPLDGLSGLLLALLFGAPLGLLVYQTAFEGYFGRWANRSAESSSSGRTAPGVEPEEDGRLATLGAASSRVQIRPDNILTAPFGRRKMPPPGFEPGTARSSVECSPSLS